MTISVPLREEAFQCLSIDARRLSGKDCSGGTTIPTLSATYELSKDRKIFRVYLALSVVLEGQDQKKLAAVRIQTRCTFEFDYVLPENSPDDPVFTRPYVAAMYQRTAEQAQRAFDMMGFAVQLPLIVLFEQLETQKS